MARRPKFFGGGGVAKRAAAAAYDRRRPCLGTIANRISFASFFSKVYQNMAETGKKLVTNKFLHQCVLLGPNNHQKNGHHLLA